MKPEITRGVRNPKVIDLIFLRAEPQEVVLQLLEDRPWQSSESQISELEEKFNNYLDYVLDGWLVKQYPQYKDLPVCLELKCSDSPGPGEQALLEEMISYANTQGLRLEVSELSPADRATLSSTDS